ncbi:MAG: NUDIX domain-containing protein [Candidatus Polarisedimenticolia bacterium]
MRGAGGGDRAPAGAGKRSAGILMHREREGRLEVLLVHPGGPLLGGRDEGAWTIPKGLIEPGEEELDAARREFEEETGLRPEGSFVPLGSVVQKGGKVVRAWAVEGDCDADAVKSNTFTMEWPPRSGRCQEFPEIDRAAFFDLDTARLKILPAQIPLLDALLEIRGRRGRA